MLLPWNTWITIDSFFRKRLKDSPFATNFQSWFGFTFMVSNVLFLLIFLRFPVWNMESRLRTGLLLTCLIFGCAMVMPFSDMNPSPYFGITLFLVLLSSFSSSLLAAFVGFASSHSPELMGYLTSGQGIAGVLPATVQIVLVMSQALDNKPSNVASYFGVSVFLCLCSYFGLSFTKLESVEEEALLEEEEQTDESPSAQQVAYGIRYIILSTFINFFCILALFPSLTSRVSPQTDFPLFVPLHFLVFNVADWIGKSSSIFFKQKLINQHLILMITLTRLLFIPLFLMCHLDKSYLPTVFGDGMYFVILLLFGFSGGFLNSILFVQAPLVLVAKGWTDATSQSIVGDLLGTALGSGLAAGSVFSILFLP
ncbi:nucleoside transporter-domain-containing protein [Gorgonomyces haynaldii]|nr:nucleoside transporter-domain-containing protein [Gorgonomyces haynaldii]